VRSGKIASLFGLLTFAALSAAQNADIDSLFEDPREDIEQAREASPQADHRSSFEKADKVVISGNFTAIGGGAFGWTEFPDPNRPELYWDRTPLASSEAAFVLNARPDPTFRFYAKYLATMKPKDGFTWTSLTLSELFCDYIYRDFLYARFGKQTIGWGQGRLYTPGDLMDTSEEGTSVKLSLPTVLSGVSFVALAKKTYFRDIKTPSYTEVVYGAIADATLAGFRLTAGARYQKDAKTADSSFGLGFNGLASIKRTILGTDLFADAVLKENGGAPVWSLLGGFFREWTNTKLYGEYEWDDGTAADSVHRAGLAFTRKKLFGSGFDLGFKWLHSFSDGSGGLAVGVTASPQKHLSLSFAIPVVYGANGRFDILDDDFILTQRLSFVALVKLNVPY